MSALGLKLLPSNRPRCNPPGFDEKRLNCNEWIDETTNALGRPAGKVVV